MGELRYRAYLNTILPKEMIKKIKELSKETKVPISRLAEEAWEDFLIKRKKY